MHYMHLLFLSLAAATLVPGPFGPYDVALNVLPLTDTTRPDPLDPTGQSRTRRLLLSAFLPVPKPHPPCSPITTPYMTPPVAASYGQQAAEFGVSPSLYADFSMRFASLPSCPRSLPHESYPVILFDPGLSESRLIYGAMARSLASQGYLVITIDHPYDAPAVQFPDGTVISGIDIDPSNATVLQEILEVRTADVLFIIDQLHNKTITNALLADFTGTADLSRLAMWGHSFGGATAASVLHRDQRLVGGLDLDGMLVEPILSTDILKPFILAGQVDHAAEDPSWNQFWPHLTGPAMQIGINDTLHGSFKDILMLLSVVDIPLDIRRAIQQELGTIDPYQLDKDLNGILVAFFQFLFQERTAPLHDLPCNLANVSIVRSNF